MQDATHAEKGADHDRLKQKGDGAACLLRVRVRVRIGVRVMVPDPGRMGPRGMLQGSGIQHGHLSLESE